MPEWGALPRSPRLLPVGAPRQIRHRGKFLLAALSLVEGQRRLRRSLHGILVFVGIEGRSAAPLAWNVANLPPVQVDIVLRIIIFITEISFEADLIRAILFLARGGGLRLPVTTEARALAQEW